MRSSPTRSWRGVSAEERRAERRGQLIEAGLEVIGTQGWANTTVRGVCRRAGLTERYFYESFPDREALLLAVYEHVLVEGIRVVLAAAAEAPHDVRRTARAGIAAAVEFLIDDPRKGRVLILEATANENLQRRRQEALRAQAALLSEVAREFFGDRPPDPTDAYLTALALVGALAEVGAAYLDGQLDVSRERLIDHLTELFVASGNVSSAR
ncbi:MAG TPA: TetR/AcrR family transcriptional regulator [Actinophytocola sp.]|uniref:TetR/AcrR family transcriptional regulator n=1 Tax=Actinophytocola sp. TaxID=1872138 RepID=UPI002DDD1309|nr:TetR/AcrR family transcriptional regulator [Actinophytocola sp.]HEV2783138.1 TetR/AcrR family transcriptional regulator [Actinophytocola sp.]